MYVDHDGLINWYWWWISPFITWKAKQFATIQNTCNCEFVFSWPQSSLTRQLTWPQILPETSFHMHWEPSTTHLHTDGSHTGCNNPQCLHKLADNTTTQWLHDEHDSKSLKNQTLWPTVPWLQCYWFYHACLVVSDSHLCIPNQTPHNSWHLTHKHNANSKKHCPAQTQHLH